MRLLIKYIESRGIGKETHQSTYEGDVATIGRGTDQTIQIADRRLPPEPFAADCGGWQVESGCHR